MRKQLVLLSLLVILGGCASNNDDNGDSNSSGGGSTGGGTASTVTASQKSALLTNYADLAYDNYTDTLDDAKALLSAIEAFVANADATTFEAAKSAWIASRESYLQTEIFRLSDGPIDAEEGWVATAYGALEGQINAWPLDENMIDYTTDRDGNVTSGNIIDATSAFTPQGDEAQEVNVTAITVEAITALNENGGDANVASGYHAIEFLLWGQDQDYASFVADTVTNGALVAGERPLTDFTSSANAQRRLDYLLAAAQKLVSDLALVRSAWVKSVSTNCDTNATGCYRAALLNTLSGGDASKNLDQDEALTTIFRGMGTFMKSELANERIAVAVLTPSEEDEHSCFSDNTHRDIVQDYAGFKNILAMSYGGKGYGTSVLALLSSTLQSDLNTRIAAIDAKVAAVDTAAKTTEHFDYQIKDGSATRQTIVDMKNEMRDLGDKMIKIGEEFGLEVGDVTDPDETTI